MLIIIILCIVCLLAEGIYQLYKRNIKNLVEQKLISLVMTGKFKEFDTYVESKEVKQALPSFNIEYIKMNAAIMENNSSKIEKALSNLIDKKMNDKQKKEVYLNGFNYYIDKNDRANATKYKNMLAGISSIDAATKNYVNRLYEIKIEKKADCLNSLLNEVNNGTVNNSASHYLLIAEAYKNIGDNKNYKLYISKYQELMNIEKN